MRIILCRVKKLCRLVVVTYLRIMGSEVVQIRIVRVLKIWDLAESMGLVADGASSRSYACGSDRQTLNVERTSSDPSKDRVVRMI